MKATTTEEMATRIAELEAENERLKRTADKATSGRRGVTKYAHEFGISARSVEKAAFAVREVCFRKKREHRRPKGDARPYESDVTIKVSDMTDAEYERYSSIMAAVLSILKDNRFDPSRVIRFDEYGDISE